MKPGGDSWTRLERVESPRRNPRRRGSTRGEDRGRVVRLESRAREFIAVARLRGQTPQPQRKRRVRIAKARGTGCESARSHGDETRNRVI